MNIEHSPNLPARKRQWLLVRVVGALVLLLLAAVAIFAFVLPAPPPGPAARVALPTQIAPANTVTEAEARRREDIEVCNAALASVQGSGILPSFAVRDGDESHATAVRGRYSCGARTDASNYTVTFDLACTDLNNPRCIVPIEVRQGMVVLYQRK